MEKFLRSAEVPEISLERPEESQYSASLPQAGRALLVTPMLTGKDGVSNVSRQVADFILGNGRSFQKLLVWSLADKTCTSGSISVEGFSGAKWKFLPRALAQVFVPANDLFIFMLHLHLAPLALPIVARGGQLVTFLHGVECWQRLSVLQRKAVQCSSFVIANSEHTKRKFFSFNPVFQEDDIQVCHLGINAGNSPMVAVDRPSAPFALIVGRMDARERYKGHDLLFEIWPRLIAEIPGTRLVVVGDGTDLARLRSKALGLGLENAVEFAGSVSDERLYALYRDCSFFVMPSSGEGFGVVFLEAMRAGKPCIGAEGAAEEIIEHGISGYVVRHSCSDELFEYMKQLFLDSSLREQMGSAALQRFQSHFTVDQFQRRLLSALACHNDRQRGNSSVFRFRVHRA
jgi:phosphatidylinositol alpha-1,6-mannosyltransferase